MSLSTFVEAHEATTRDQMKTIQCMEGEILGVQKDIEALREMIRNQEQQTKNLREETWDLKDENHLLQTQLRASFQGKPETNRADHQEHETEVEDKRKFEQLC